MDTWIPLLTGHVWSTTFCGIILIDIYPNRYSLVKTIQMHQPSSGWACYWNVESVNLTDFFVDFLYLILPISASNLTLRWPRHSWAPNKSVRSVDHKVSPLPEIFAVADRGFSDVGVDIGPWCNGEEAPHAWYRGVQVMWICIVKWWKN